nr:phosphotransferase [Nocardia mexicana]
MGDTVRREPGESAEFVHRLLRFLEERGWTGAPRFLGIDPRGREVLTYVDGDVAPRAASAGEPECLVQVAELVREFHDLTAGTPLSGDREVVCHNDLSPKNTVYHFGATGPRPVAMIDWDLAAPGDRIHDVAHMCWQYLDLGPGVSDIAETADRMRLLCDAYGLDGRGAVVETVLWWQQRCRGGIESRAAAGDAAMIALRDSGVARSVGAAYEWVREHRRELEFRLS